MSNKKAFVLSGYRGVPIYGDITYSSSPSTELALFVHGFKGFKDWGAHHLIADYFAQHGVTFIKFNFSHSGVSAEDPNDITNMDLFATNTPSGELEDLDIVLEFIAGNFPDASITLIGHSRGGGLSILKAATSPMVKKLITWAAIDDFRDLWGRDKEMEWEERKQLEIYNGRTKTYMPLDISVLHDVLKNSVKLDIKRAAQELKKPWLIINGDQDPAVAASKAENFHRLNPGSALHIIAAGDHVFGARHPYPFDKLPDKLSEVCALSVDFAKASS